MVLPMLLLLWFCTVELLIFKCSLKHFSLGFRSLGVRVWEFVSRWRRKFQSWLQVPSVCFIWFVVFFTYDSFWSEAFFLCVLLSVKSYVVRRILWIWFTDSCDGSKRMETTWNGMEWKEQNHYYHHSWMYISFIVSFFSLDYNHYSMNGWKNAMLESVWFIFLKKRICAKDNRQNARTQYTHTHTHIHRHTHIRARRRIHSIFIA